MERNDSNNTVQTNSSENNRMPEDFNPVMESNANPTLPTMPKRISMRQRKESLEEYRETFLQVPILDDRKPAFISREVRDSLDEIVRRLGGRRMSVSGFIENLARHHLDAYREDIEVWRKL